MTRTFLIICILFVPLVANSQAKRALGLIEKMRYEQAQDILYKSIGKDSLAPGEKYVLSILLFTEDYYYNNLDSAYYYILEAIREYEIADEKTIEKLLKDEITIEHLIQQKNNIESFEFEIAKENNSEVAYIEYLNKFPTSRLADSAVYYRNISAFEYASSTNTWESYQEFMNKYPDSDQYEESEKRFNKLIFEEKTADGKLSSLENFLRDYPRTPYRNEIVKNIFTITTGGHKPESYIEFSQKFPDSELARLSAARIYHATADHELARAEYTEFIYRYLDADSLRDLEFREKSILFPVLDQTGFYFLDNDGRKILNESFSSLPDDYLCGNISETFFLMTDNENSQIINRAGSIVYEELQITEAKELGNGFVAIGKGGKTGVIFKTGELILPAQYDDVRVIGGQFISFLDNNKWGIATVNGEIILKPGFSIIDEFSSLIRISDNEGRFTFLKPQDLYPLLDSDPIELEFLYDDAELIENGLILTYSGNKQGIIDLNLEEIITLGNQEIIQINKNLLIETEEGVNLESEVIDLSSGLSWEDLDFNSGWIALKGPNGWILISLSENGIVSEYVDSLRLLNRSTSLVYKNGVRSIFTQNGREIQLKSSSKLEVITSPPTENLQSKYYSLVKDNNSKWLINNLGDTILNHDFRDVRAFGDEYLVVSERRGSGLWDNRGRQLLAAEFDGIANYSNGSLTLLKDGKLGYYRLSDSTYIPPKYMKSLKDYDSTLIIAYTDAYGLINRKDESVTEFEFDDISYFSDSSAWVKTGEHWSLYNFMEKKYLLTAIDSFYPDDRTSSEYIFVRAKSGNGVFHKKTGTIINATFNEIRNVGFENDPVFLAEKYVEEADYYVIVYYNKDGEIIYRQGYPSEEYEKLICVN